MNFEPASQNGVIPITDYKTKDSDFMVGVSSTSTVAGHPVVLKAISNAAMYKTVPVTFYATQTVGTQTNTITLGQAAFTDAANASLLINNLSAGTYSIYAEWPGEARYAPKSTKFNPVPLTIAEGTTLGTPMSLTATPASDSIVTGEGTVTFSANLNAPINVIGNILFFDGSMPLGSAPLIANTAFIEVSNLSAGPHTIRAVWAGATINGVTYAGKNASISYSVRRGSISGYDLRLAINKTTAVVDEGTIELTATLGWPYQTALSGNITFYAISNNGNEEIIGISSLDQRVAKLTVDNKFPIGTTTFYARWDGNQTSHPRYLEVDSEPKFITITERQSVPAPILMVSTATSVYNVSNVTYTSTFNTSTTVTGVVQFFGNDIFIGQSSIANNVATVIKPALPIGNYNIRADFLGSSVAPKFYSTTSNIVAHTVEDGFEFVGNITLTSDFAPITNIDQLDFTVSANTSEKLNGQISIIENQKIPTVINNYSTSTSYSFDTVYLNKDYFFISNPNYKFFIYNNSIPKNSKINYEFNSQTGTYIVREWVKIINPDDTIEYANALEFLSGIDVLSIAVDLYAVNAPNWIVEHAVTKKQPIYTFTGTSTVLVDVVKPVATSSFVNTNTIRVTIPSMTVNTNTTTNFLYARWAGGITNTGKPYKGEDSAVISLVHEPVVMKLTPVNHLSSSIYPSIAVYPTTSSVTMIASLNSINPVFSTGTTNTVVISERTNALTTATFSTNTSTVAINSLPVGPYYLKGTFNRDAGDYNYATTSTQRIGVYNPSAFELYAEVSRLNSSNYTINDTVGNSRFQLQKLVSYPATVNGQTNHQKIGFTIAPCGGFSESYFNKGYNYSVTFEVYEIRNNVTTRVAYQARTIPMDDFFQCNPFTVTWDPNIGSIQSAGVRTYKVKIQPFSQEYILTVTYTNT